MYTKMTAYERFLSLHPASVVTRAFTELGRNFERNARLRRDRRLLNDMPDNLLSDMGISRHEIDSVTSWRAPDVSRRPRD